MNPRTIIIVMLLIIGTASLLTAFASFISIYVLHKEVGKAEKRLLFSPNEYAELPEKQAQVRVVEIAKLMDADSHARMGIAKLKFSDGARKDFYVPQEFINLAAENTTGTITYKERQESQVDEVLQGVDAKMRRLFGTKLINFTFKKPVSKDKMVRARLETYDRLFVRFDADIQGEIQ